MKAACVETPFRASSPEQGRAHIAYLAEVMAWAYAWGWSPYASHDTIPRLLAKGGEIDTADADVLARARGLAAGDAWAERADLIVFGVDLGWSPGMRRRLAHVWARGHSAPRIEVQFVRRGPGGGFLVETPTMREAGEVLGW